MVTPTVGVSISQNMPQYSHVRTRRWSTRSSRSTPANLPRSVSSAIVAPHRRHPGGPARLGIGFLFALRDLSRTRRRLLFGAAFRSGRSEEHTSELQSLMRISYAVFCLTKIKARGYQQLA